MSVEDMLIQIRHTIVSRCNLGQKRQGPTETSSKNDIINIGFKSAILEMHSPLIVTTTRDMRDRRSTLDLGMLKGQVAKVCVVATTHHGNNWCLGAVN